MLYSVFGGFFNVPRSDAERTVTQWMGFWLQTRWPFNALSRLLCCDWMTGDWRHWRSPLWNTLQWVWLCEYVWGEQLNLVSKVGTLNTKMLDHLWEIRDNPARPQLLEVSCRLDLLLVLWLKDFSPPSAPKYKEIQRECWSRELATFLSLRLWALTLSFLQLNVEMSILLCFCVCVCVLNVRENPIRDSFSAACRVWFPAGCRSVILFILMFTRQGQSGSFLWNSRHLGLRHTLAIAVIDQPTQAARKRTKAAGFPYIFVTGVVEIARSCFTKGFVTLAATSSEQDHKKR